MPAFPASDLRVAFLFGGEPSLLTFLGLTFWSLLGLFDVLLVFLPSFFGLVDMLLLPFFFFGLSSLEDCLCGCLRKKIKKNLVI